MMGVPVSLPSTSLRRRARATVMELANWLPTTEWRLSGASGILETLHRSIERSNMSRDSRYGFALAIAAMLLVTPHVHGQYSSHINSNSAARVGLEPAWATVVATGNGGRIRGATVHVSGTNNYQTTIITDKFGRKDYFSERSVTRSGTTLGLDQSLRLAELREAVLKRRGLDPIVETKVIPDITVYLRSSLGTVVSVNAETGRIKWTTQAGKDGYPNYVVAATDDYVATSSGTTLYLLNASNGDILQTKSLMRAPGAGPSFAGSQIYVPTIHGLVEVYDANNIRDLAFTLGSPGRIRQPVTVGPLSVSWTTDRGDVYVAAPREPGIIYQFQALGPITDAPVHLGDKLYASSVDGFIYAIAEKDGEVQWRYSMGEPIRSSPLAVDDTVFVITDHGKLACLDAASGDVRWLSFGVASFLAVSDSRLYCATSSNTLVALDRTSGGRVGETMLSPQHIPVVNTKTDRVYLAGGEGAFQCLREKGERLPLARFVPTPSEEADDQAVDESSVATTEQPPTESPPAIAADEGEDINPFTGEPVSADGGDDFSFDDLGGDDADPDAGEENPFAPF